MIYAKRLAGRLSPRGYASLRALWHRANPLSPHKRIARALDRAYGDKIADGPFAGMRYIHTAAGSAYAPKRLGCYEAELHPALEQVFTTGYETVIDVGCAEGYYAVGLAYRLPEVHVYACDIDPRARQRCAELAALNGVSDRIVLWDACTPTTLAALPPSRTLLICDCEGCELELLQPEQAPSLASFDLLIELHDVFVPGLSEQLLPRFQNTHALRLIDSVSRDPGQVPSIRCLEPRDWKLAVREGRSGPQQWAFLTARP